MSGPVLVGVDGSVTSMAAVETAARLADRLGVGIRLTQACEWPAAPVPPGAPLWNAGGGGTHGLVKGALTEAERRARCTAPWLRVTHQVLVGDPVTVLESESRGASLTVVGSRPTSRSGGERRGSVAVRLAARGRCSVLVVRGGPDRTGSVVLTGEHGHAGREAAEFAFAEASARGTDLVVLDGLGTLDRRPRNDFDDRLSALREKYPDVDVRRPRVPGRTRRAVIDASTHAQLLVVGTPGRRGAAASLPTWVGRTALRHADCSVAVIRAEEENRRRDR
ncbi:universal stress protein [Streptomyces sp. NPDC087903]|uniref:universal stress protein n=1 Tax=Streptomyces sp. NPDC087903 TaxID=3365819 RepID=UPI00380FB2E6